MEDDIKDNIRNYAIGIVDEFTCELGNTYTQLDFNKITSKDMVKLIDHIAEIITKAII
jgi:hypothetical protein